MSSQSEFSELYMKGHKNGFPGGVHPMSPGQELDPEMYYDNYKVSS